MERNIYQTITPIVAEINLSAAHAGTAFSTAGYHDIGIDVVATTAAASTLTATLQYSYDDATWNSSPYVISVPASVTNTSHLMDVSLDQGYWPNIINAGTTGAFFLRLNFTDTGTVNYAYRAVTRLAQSPGIKQTNYTFAG